MFAQQTLKVRLCVTKVRLVLILWIGPDSNIDHRRRGLGWRNGVCRRLGADRRQRDADDDECDDDR